MTKKDYIALANIIKELRKTAYTESRALILNRVTDKLTDYCELDNPRFDKDTFIKATQLKEVSNERQ